MNEYIIYTICGRHGIAFNVCDLESIKIEEENDVKLAELEGDFYESMFDFNIKNEVGMNDEGEYIIVDCLDKIEEGVNKMIKYYNDIEEYSLVISEEVMSKLKSGNVNFLEI